MARKVITLYPNPTISQQEDNAEIIKTKVAAYCRVSSASDEQLHSVKAQIDYYKDYILSNPKYEFAGIYADEGISGTQVIHRDAFSRMIVDCRNSLIDMIITKSVSRFGRNTVDTLRFAKQRHYCNDHHISTYHRCNKENPLSARITCPICGSTYMLLKSKRKGDEGRAYWRCSSFIGKNGTEIEGRTFTPPPMALWSKDPNSRYATYRSKNRKLPQSRLMLCTDIQIDAGLPERAFVKAWNLLVSHRIRYMASFKNAVINNDDLLLKHRLNEFIKTLETAEFIKEFDYELSLKTLDHFEVCDDGRLSVKFLTETRFTF